MRFLVVEDENRVTRAFNLDHVALVALTGCDRSGDRQPTVVVVLTDGTQFERCWVPVANEVKQAVNAHWAGEQVAAAIVHFFDRLRDEV